MAAFFERTSSGDEFENGFGFASELGEEQREGCFVDFQEALPAPAPPPFYHVVSRGLGRRAWSHRESARERESN